MKILFVTENLSCRCGANVNIILKLAKHLENANELFILTRIGQDIPLDKQKTPCFADVITFRCDAMDYLAEYQTRNAWQRSSGIRRIFLMLKSPKFLRYKLDDKYNDAGFLRKKYREALEKACRLQKFDVVIGVVMPYYIARAVADANIPCAKTIFQLDPYSYNYTLPKWQTKSRLRIERKLIDRIDLLFAVFFVEKEIREKGISLRGDKIARFRLPGISKEDILAEDSGEEKHENKKSTAIRFAYIGVFYSVIRNPRFLLELFTRLPENYELHLVGGCLEALPETYGGKLGERLVCHGWVSSEEAARKMREADVLINLNNTVKNQLPSKLLEYISTGKPILNICKVADCQSLEYTGRYENCLNIFEGQGIDETLLHRIEEFVLRHKGTVMERSKILEVYHENTDVCVAELLENRLVKLTVWKGNEDGKRQE